MESSKKIKVKLINLQTLKFEILETAKPGDYFVINDHENSEVIESINNLINQKYNANIEIETNKKIAQVKSQYEEIVKVKYQEGFNLAKNEQEKNLEIMKNKLATADENLKISLVAKTNELQLQFANKEKDLAKKLWEKNNEINDLKKEKEILEKSLNNQVKIKELEFEKKLLEVKQLETEKHQAKIDELTNEIEQLKRLRSTNSKIMGEDFEKWVDEEYNNSLGVLDDTAFNKITINKNGQKADFLFEVFDTSQNVKNTLAKVVVEVKTQSQNGTKKNSDFYAKLQKDKQNENAEYALLISELEPNDNFIIKKINEYENMYLVRPSYFITFLSLVRTLSLKRKEIIKANLEFYKKQDILKQFEIFKEDALNKTINSLENKVADIQKHNIKILEATHKIDDLTQDILTKIIERFKNKINKLSITKIANNIEKLEMDN
ncbi:DUF2130 domain-containing protein [Candidatus Mycoplasma pogonae]